MKATIDGGFWAGRRQFNRDVLIPDGERQIREAGTFDNLRAAATGSGTHRGLVYQDSDLHKWVEALGWELRNAPSPALQRMADEVTALLIAAQAPDGYLDTAFQVTGHPRYRNLADEHEIYCMGHLIEAGLAHPPLLPVARRVADHLVATFTDRPGFCGHPEAELALVKLYRATGERAYLELARRFVDRRGHGTLPQRYGSSAYLVDRVPVREQTVVEGHCVRQLYLNCGATDVFTELGEPLDPLLAAWEDMVDGKTYITGGVGSDRAHEAFGAPFEIAPASAYAETCAAIASVFWNWRLLQATGEARFADRRYVGELRMALRCRDCDRELEDGCDGALRNRRAFIVDREDDVVALVTRSDGDRGVLAAVLDGIADQVGGALLPLRAPRHWRLRAGLIALAVRWLIRLIAR